MHPVLHFTPSDSVVSTYRPVSPHQDRDESCWCYLCTYLYIWHSWPCLCGSVSSEIIQTLSAVEWWYSKKSFKDRCLSKKGSPEHAQFKCTLCFLQNAFLKCVCFVVVFFKHVYLLHAHGGNQRKVMFSSFKLGIVRQKKALYRHCHTLCNDWHCKALVHECVTPVHSWMNESETCCRQLICFFFVKDSHHIPVQTLCWCCDSYARFISKTKAGHMTFTAEHKQNCIKTSTEWCVFFP